MTRYRVPASAVGTTNGAHLLIAVDPGGRRADDRRCGVSVWLVSPLLELPDGVLLGAGHVALDDIDRWIAEVARDVPRTAVAWVVESPHLRGDQHAQRRGVEALRRTLAILRARRTSGSTWRAVRPHRWKGNVPKEVHHRRVLRALFATEAAGVGRPLDPDSPAYQADTADAIALGAWALGRTDRGGVLPGAASGGGGAAGGGATAPHR
jgi:hypothetical protein